MREYLSERDVVKKFAQFQAVCGAIKRTLQRKTLKKTAEFYKVMAVPTLLYASETWVVKKYE